MWKDKRRREVREEKVEKMNGKVVGWGIVLALVLSVALGAFLVSVSAQAPPPPLKLPYVVLTADPSEIVADGSATSTINASVWLWDENDEAYNEQIWVGVGAVEFSTDLGEITESAKIINGTATAILTAGTEPGVATITAKMDVEDIGLGTNTTTVTFTPTGDGGDGGNGGGSSSGGSSGGTTTTPTPTVTTSPGVTPTPASTATPGPTTGATTPGPTVTPGATPGPTTTTTPTPASATPTPKEPGFGAVFAMIGLLAVAYLLMWKRN